MLLLIIKDVVVPGRFIEAPVHELSLWSSELVECVVLLAVAQKAVAMVCRILHLFSLSCHLKTYILKLPKKCLLLLALNIELVKSAVHLPVAVGVIRSLLDHSEWPVPLVVMLHRFPDSSALADVGCPDGILPGLVRVESGSSIH